MSILWIVIFLALPAFLLWLCDKLPSLNKIGVVILCYAVGMVIGNTGLLPEAFTTAAQPGRDSTLSLLQSVTICIALPMILFSLDIRRWFRIAKKGLLCMLLACVSVIVVTCIIHLCVGGSDPDSAEYAAASVAVYTGGTVNLGSIRASIGLSADDFIVFNTYDAFLSVLYLLFLSTAARPVFRKVFRMPVYEVGTFSGEAADSDAIDESPAAFKTLLKKKNFPGMLAALGISAVIFGVSYGLNMLASKFDPSLGMTVMMLTITTLSILCSFSPKIRSLNCSFQFGMYIIYVFCLSVAASADFKALLNFDPVIFIYVAVSIAGSMLLHAFLSSLFRIDTDTMIITSVSAVCSPPFVPSVAASLKNRDVMLTGLATGVIGYALGNYLGIAVNWLFRLF